MTDTVLTIGGSLAVASIVLPFALGWPALLGGTAHDEWQAYRRKRRDIKFSRKECRIHLLTVFALVWLLIVTAVLYAGVAMKMWEMWR